MYNIFMNYNTKYRVEVLFKECHDSLLTMGPFYMLIDKEKIKPLIIKSPRVTY